MSGILTHIFIYLQQHFPLRESPAQSRTGSFIIDVFASYSKECLENFMTRRQTGIKNSTLCAYL